MGRDNLIASRHNRRPQIKSQDLPLSPNTERRTLKPFLSMNASPEIEFDCVLSGTLVCDILVRPVPVGCGIRPEDLVQVDPIEVTTGGLVANTGIAMARFGKRVAVFSYVGDDHWGSLLRKQLTVNGVDTGPLMTHTDQATSSTVVMIDVQGERSFVHAPGAPSQLNKQVFLKNLGLFARSRMALFGYYSLVPHLDNDLPEILREVRRTGCRTAMDAAGTGGSMQPLDRILPELDVYIPSLTEARHQTGQTNPRRIVQTYRDCGAPGILGVKLGADGALLSPRSGEYISVARVEPPGPIIDTTGAGDCFYAGLLTGILDGLPLEESGQLAAAAGACCVTAAGASAGIRNLSETMTLARSNSQ